MRVYLPVVAMRLLKKSKDCVCVVLDCLSEFELFKMKIRNVYRGKERNRNFRN